MLLPVYFLNAFLSFTFHTYNNPFVDLMSTIYMYKLSTEFSKDFSNKLTGIKKALNSVFQGAASFIAMTDKL